VWSLVAETISWILEQTNHQHQMYVVVKVQQHVRTRITIQKQQHRATWVASTVATQKTNEHQEHGFYKQMFKRTAVAS
jgi:multidrug resistance efflux pump